MDTLGDYERWKASRQQGGIGAAEIVLDAVEGTPDEAAGLVNLANDFAKTTGSPVPPLPMVKEYSGTFQKAVEREKNRTILSSSPLLAEWLRNPDNAVLAKDDLQNLSWFEGAARGSANTLARSRERLGQMGNQYMLNQTAGRLRDRGMSFGQILDSERDVIETPDGKAKTWINLGDMFSATARWVDARYADVIGTDDEANARAYAEALNGNIERFKAIPKSAIASEAEQSMFQDGATLGQTLKNVGSTMLSNPVGVLSWALETMGESAPQLAAAIGTTVATRNPTAGIAVGTIGSYATERFVAPADFLAEKGIDLSKPEDVGRILSEPQLLQEANERGVIRGSIIAAFDTLSLGLAGRVMANKPMVEAFAQTVQQAISGSLGEYTARLAAGQEIDWNEIIAEGLAEVATAPIDMGTAGRKLLQDRRRAKNAEGTVAQLGEISAQAQGSALRNRMPDKFRQFVEAATANGPVENVFIPADQFVGYFQGIDIDPYELIDELDGVTRDDLDAALAGGGDLQIPTATYAAKIAGSEHDQFLMENMRFDPDEFTAAEARDFNERAQDAMDEAWEIAEAVRQEREELTAIEDQIYDSMVSRLRVAGRSTDVATTEAMLYPAFYRVMAERSGMSTGEFLGRYPLPEIRGDLPQGLQLRDVDELNRTLAEARNRRALGAEKRGPSLLEFISDYGGINDPGGELRSRDASVIRRGKGKKTLKLERGGVMAGARDLLGSVSGSGKKHGVDDVALAAIEAGYMADDPDVIAYRAAVEEGRETPDITRALWDAIDRELRGEAQFAGSADTQADDQERALDEIEAYLSSLGVSLEDDDATIRQALEAAQQYAQETSKNLIVQHNLTAANLLHADKMRGLAVPSVAISNVDYPLDGFGEITLLGGPDLIDPRKDSSAKVFDADVYSPRYPTVRYKIATKEMNKVWKRLGGVSEELGHVLSGELDNSEVERKGLEAFRDSSAVQLQFLRDTGRDIELPQERARSNYLTQAPELAGLISEYDMYSEIMAKPEAVAALTKAVDIEIAKIQDASPDIDIDRVRGYYYDRDGDIKRSVIDNIKAEIKVARNPGVDRYAARTAIREAIAPNADEFAAWVEEQFGSVFAGEQVVTETASGDWKYLPHTLDNVVKVLKKKLRDGEGFNYGVGSIRSTVANQFKSVSAIQKARGRLIPADAMKALKDEVDNEFVSLAGRMGEYSDFSDGFGWLDTFSEHMKEVAERGVRALRPYYKNLPPEMEQEVAAFLDKLANMPTEYFEAKLQRAVDLSEFKAAVIPSDAPQAAKDALKYARVPAFEYDPKVSGARAAAIRAASGEQNLLFQSGDVRGARGMIQFPAGGVGRGDTIIRLFQSADLSTMIHESGHYFLTVMRDMAANGGEIAQDFDTVKAWWQSNAQAVAKDAMRVMPDVKVSADDVIAAIEAGTTGDVMKDAAVDVGMQEQFARAFETYLMEGKAPSIDLRTAFEKFRSWLISIYQKLAGLNVNVSDDIRAVFDRMLATDEEIAKAQASTGGDAPVFLSAEAMGLTDEEYANFLKLRSQAEDEAKARLLRETMAPIKRAKEQWFKDERAKVREEVEREVNAIRYFRAIEWMGNRRWLGDGQPADMPDMRLSKKILVERYGAGVLDTLPRGMQRVYSVDGGFDPDDAAGWFGFDSGDEMIRAMEKAPKRVDAIDAETDRIMRERHGDALNDGSIEAEAISVVHNDKRGQWIAAELKAVVEISGTGVGMTAKEARASAKATIARMRVRDAISAGRFLAAERKAADEAARLGAQLARDKIWTDAARRRIANTARAAMKGKASPDAVAGAIEDYNSRFETTSTTYNVQAQERVSSKGRAFTIPAGERTTTSLGYNDLVAKLVEAKRRQLVNHALYMEARKVADEVEAAERFVAKLNKKSTRERIAGAGRRENETIDYLAAIDDLLERYDFRRMSGRAEARLQARRGSLVAFVEAMKAAGRENELAIPDDVLADAARKPYKTVPVEELRGVIDSLKNLEHIALRWNKLIDAMGERERDVAVGEIVSAFDENVKKRPPGRVGSTSEGLRNAGRQFLDLVLNAGTILREIDGFKDLGAAYRNIKSPIDEAMTRLIVRKEKAATDLEALYSVYSKEDRRRMTVREHMPELGYALSKWERIAVALNTGNAGNLQRMTDRRVRGHLTEPQVQAVLATLDERDANFVQSVWDYVGSFRDDIAAREKRTTGVEPAWVEASPVVIGGKTLKGGYYPLKYDPRLSSLARDDDAAALATSLQAGRFGKAQTRNGHVKARAQASGRAVELDMSVLHRHVNQVIYDLELSEPVSNSWRILQDGRVRSAFMDAGKQADFDALEIWLQDVGNGELRSADFIGRGARLLKSNFTAAKLAFNLGTVAVQVTGLSQSMVVVGKKNVALGIMRTAANPSLASSEVAAKSPFMATRQTTFNKDIYDFYSDPKTGPIASRWGEIKSEIIGPLSFWLMTKVQWYLVDVPTWLAGYHQGLGMFGNDEAKAIAHADAIVKRAQASGLFSDRSAVERGSVSRTARQNDVVRLFTALGSYMFAKFNVAYERSAQASRVIGEEGVSMRSTQEALSWTLDMAFLFTLEAVLIAALKGRLPGGEDDDEDDDGWAAFLAKETAFGIMGTVPVVRDISGPLQGFDGGGAYGAITKEIAAPFIQMKQGEVDPALVKSVINATALATGLPATQINRAVDAGWREAEGEEVSPLEYLLGRSGK